MKYCPICQEETVYYEKRDEYICTDGDCNWRGQKPLDRKIFIANFYEEAFESFPFLIAHEYYQLHMLVKKQKIYGALLQLKDVFEVTIKLPTLVAISILRQKDYYQNKVFSTLLYKSVNLGDWYKIARMLSSKKANDLPIPQELRRLLKNICSFYENKQHDICAWRNEQIGHGALSIDEDYCWENELYPYLQALEKHYRQNAELYKAIIIKDVHEQGIYMGKSSVQLAHEQLVYAGDELINLFPYVVVEDEGVFLFDTYYPQKKTTILNYPNGRKKEDRSVIYRELTYDYKRLIKMETMQKSSDRELTSDTISLEDIDHLYQIQKIEDFVTPSYLQKYVNDMLKQYEKGIFLIQMEQGMGKTTFVRGMDDLSLAKIKHEGISCRCYYLNNTFASDPRYFAEQFTDALQLNKNGSRGFISLDHRLTADHPEKFVEVLNHYYQAHVDHFKVNKLILMIDGLDEMSTQEQDIWSFIGLNDELLSQLNENIYLFFTCRTNKELSKKTIANLENITFTHDPAIFDRTLTDYQALLKIFLSKFTVLSKETILQLTNGRFSEVRLLKELSEAGFIEFQEQTSIFKCYVDYLQEQYGAKYFQQFIDLLVLLAYAEEPITIDEIAYALQEQHITFRLLGILLDLRPLLTIQQNQNRHVIALSHDCWKDYSKEHFAESFHKLVTHFTSFEKDYVPKSIDVLDVEAELLAFLCSNYGQYLLPLLTKQEKISLFSSMHHIALMFNENNLYLYRWQRAEKMMKLILQEPDTIELVGYKCGAYNQLANSAYKQRKFEQALAIIDQGIEWLKSQKFGYSSQHLVQLLQKKMLIMHELKHTAEVDEISIEISKLQSYSSVSTLQKIEHQYNEAVQAIETQNIDKAIALTSDIIQYFKKNGYHSSDETILYLLSYSCRSRAYLQLNQLKKALDDNEKAIQFLSQVKKMSEDKYIKHAIDLYHNNGNIYRQMDSFEPAIKYYSASLTIIEDLERNSKSIAHEHAIETLSFRAFCYGKLSKLDAQLSDVKQIIRFIETYDPKNTKNLLDFCLLALELQNHLQRFNDMLPSFLIAFEGFKKLNREDGEEYKYFIEFLKFIKYRISDKTIQQTMTDYILNFVTTDMPKEDSQVIFDFFKK